MFLGGGFGVVGRFWGDFWGSLGSVFWGHFGMVEDLKVILGYFEVVGG